MNKKILVTGVSGQDGSYMVDYLLENTDHDIYGMVRRTSNPYYPNLTQALKNNRFKLVTGDLSDSQSIDKVVQKIMPDYFINLAAQSFVAGSWELPEQTMDSNATGVARCLESIVRYVPHCRFYNAGSSEEFGDVQYTPQNEKHPLRARSPYGASKIAARQIVKTYRESFKLYAVQGILFNHESPRRGEEFVTRKITKGVARIKYAIEHNLPFEPIELGNLDAKRDWSHAKDFVRGIWMMLNQDENNFKEYVMSSNETHSIREFVSLAFKEAGFNCYWLNDQYILKEDSSIHPDRVVVNVNRKFFRPADVEYLCGNSTLIRNELGWKPEYSFQDLVKEMVENDIKEYAKSA